MIKERFDRDRARAHLVEADFLESELARLEREIAEKEAAWQKVTEKQAAADRLNAEPYVADETELRNEAMDFANQVSDIEYDIRERQRQIKILPTSGLGSKISSFFERRRLEGEIEALEERKAVPNKGKEEANAQLGEVRAKRRQWEKLVGELGIATVRQQREGLEKLRRERRDMLQRLGRPETQAVAK